MSKILITGGTGFIGTNLSNSLKKRGHQVIVSDLLSSNLDNSIRCDVSNYRQLENLFQKIENIDFVYHLAAEYGRWNGEDYFENLWQTNVIGLKNIIRLQEQLKFKMIFFSSAEVYGDFDNEMSESIMKDNPISDTYQMNDYAISKWAGELICMNSMRMFDTKTVIVRPVNCYGPYEHYTPYRGFIPKFIYKNLMKQTYEVYKGHYRIIDYVDDTCNTLSNILTNFKSGEAYNVGSDQKWEYDIKTYSDIIIKLIGINDNHVKYFDSEINTTKRKKIDFSKAIKDLGHDPKISPEEGIEKTIKWMKDYYRI